MSDHDTTQVLAVTRNPSLVIGLTFLDRPWEVNSQDTADDADRYDVIVIDQSTTEVEVGWLDAGGENRPPVVLVSDDSVEMEPPDRVVLRPYTLDTLATVIDQVLTGTQVEAAAADASEDDDADLGSERNTHPAGNGGNGPAGDKDDVAGHDQHVTPLIDLTGEEDTRSSSTPREAADGLSATAASPQTTATAWTSSAKPPEPPEPPPPPATATPAAAAESELPPAFDSDPPDEATAPEPQPEATAVAEPEARTAETPGPAGENDAGAATGTLTRAQPTESDDEATEGTRDASASRPQSPTARLRGRFRRTERAATSTSNTNEAALRQRLADVITASSQLEDLVHELPALRTMPRLGQAILEQIAGDLQPDTAALWQHREEGFVAVASIGLSAAAQRLPVRSDQPMLAEVWASGGGLLIDPIESAQAAVAGIGGASTASFMAAAIALGPGRYGIITVGRNDPLDGDDLDQLLAVANEAAPGVAVADQLARLAELVEPPQPPRASEAEDSYW